MTSRLTGLNFTGFGKLPTLTKVNSAKQISGEWRVLMKKGKGYQQDLPRRLYTFFATYDNPLGLPSFSKFARQLGLTLEELSCFRRKREFERAWQECIEIRRDYLIDLAITKRADASFAKFLLSESEESNDDALSVTVSVIE